MIKVTEIKRTCLACPSQWEGKAASGYVYVRFRWGHLRVGVGATVKDAARAEPIFEWDDADSFNGFMEYDEMKRVTAGVLDLPEKESTEDQDLPDAVKW